MRLMMYTMLMMGLMDMDDQDIRILTTRQVCELLKVKRLMLYKLIKTDGFPGFKIGNGWRFERGEIVRWVAGRMGR